MISVRSLIAMTGVAAAVVTASAPALAADAICYNCPPQWADWKSQLEAVAKNTGIKMPHDNKNSGQTLSQMLAEKANPVADIAYYGVTFGIKAKAQGVTASWAERS